MLSCVRVTPVTYGSCRKSLRIFKNHSIWLLGLIGNVKSFKSFHWNNTTFPIFNVVCNHTNIQAHSFEQRVFNVYSKLWNFPLKDYVWHVKYRYHVKKCILCLSLNPFFSDCNIMMYNVSEREKSYSTTINWKWTFLISLDVNR